MENVRRTTIPAGFRFSPTEGELVGEYLMRKINNQPLPCDIIKEVALYKYDDPDHLTAINKSMTGENVWYFFTKRDKRRGSRPDRTTGNGVWKASRSKKQITYRGEVVGSIMHLVFCYRNSAAKEVKTKWLMTEFKSKDGESFDDWVLCKIYKNGTCPNKDSVPVASTSSLAEADQCGKMVIDDGQELVHSEKVDENQNHKAITDHEMDGRLRFPPEHMVDAFQAQVSPLPGCFIEHNLQGIDNDREMLLQPENGECNMYNNTADFQDPLSKMNDQEFSDYTGKEIVVTDDDISYLEKMCEPYCNGVIGDKQKSIDVDQELVLVHSENGECSKQAASDEHSSQFVSAGQQCIMIDEFHAQSENGKDKQLVATDDDPEISGSLGDIIIDESFQEIWDLLKPITEEGTLDLPIDFSNFPPTDFN